MLVLTLVLLLAPSPEYRIPERRIGRRRLPKR
jgi:hypothetical protein